MAKKNLVFDTASQNSRGKTRKFWSILIVSVLVVLTVSLAAILKSNDYDIDTAFGFEKETETTDEVKSTEQISFIDERTFLIWCAESDRQSMDFMTLVKVKLPECRVTACSLDVNAVLSSVGETAAAVYAKAGERALVSALEDTYKINIDRYAGASATEFKTLINYFGGMMITVPEQIEYKTDDLSLILIKGKQNIKGDTMYKYMLYLNSLGRQGKTLQSEAIIEILGGIFTPKHTERRERIFSQITNTMSTDMTIVDFSEKESGIILLMKNGILQSEAVDSPDELS